MATIDQILREREQGREPLPPPAGEFTPSSYTGTTGGGGGDGGGAVDTRQAAINAIMRYYGEQDQGVAMDPATGEIYNVQGSSMSWADAEQLYDALTSSGWTGGQILGSYTGMGEPPGFETISPDQAARLVQQEREFEETLPLEERAVEVGERTAKLAEDEFYASQEGLDAEQLVALGVPREWATAIAGRPASEQRQWIDDKYRQAIESGDADLAERMFLLDAKYKNFLMDDAERQYGLDVRDISLRESQLDYDKERDVLDREIAKSQVAADMAMVDAKIAGDKLDYEAEMAATREAERHNKIIEGLETRRVDLDEKKFTLDLATSPRNMLAGFFIAQGQNPPWMEGFQKGQVPTMHPAFAKALGNVAQQGQGAGMGAQGAGQAAGAPTGGVASPQAQVRGRARGDQQASNYFQRGRIAQLAQAGQGAQQAAPEAGQFAGGFARGGTITRPSQMVRGQGGARPDLGQDFRRATIGPGSRRYGAPRPEPRERFRRPEGPGYVPLRPSQFVRSPELLEGYANVLLRNLPPNLAQAVLGGGRGLEAAPGATARGVGQGGQAVSFLAGEPQVDGRPNPEVIQVSPDRVDITPVNRSRPSQWAGGFAQGGTIPQPFQDIEAAGFPIPPAMYEVLRGQPVSGVMDMASTVGGALPSMQSLGKLSPSFAEFLISSLGAVYGQDFDDLLWGIQKPYEGLRALTPGTVSYR